MLAESSRPAGRLNSLLQPSGPLSFKEGGGSGVLSLAKRTSAAPQKDTGALSRSSEKRTKKKSDIIKIYKKKREGSLK